jgi:hypothetical protein
MALQFSGILESIYSGASTARTARWYSADYIDRVLFATPSVQPLFWPGSGKARPIPGLPDANGYDGVEVFDDHVMLWRGALLKWSGRSDFANWVPVAATAAFGTATLESDFTMTPAGSTTAHAYMTGLAGEFVAGQFARIVSYETDLKKISYDYFRVADVALETFQKTNSIKRSQSVDAGAKKRIYLGRYDTYVNWTTGARLKIDGGATTLTVTARSRNANYFYQTSGPSDPVPDIGAKMVVPFGTVPTEMFAGDVVSIGPTENPGQDLYLVKNAPSFSVTLERIGIGDRSPGQVFSAASGVSFQNWVEVENTGTDGVTIPPEADVAVVSSLVLSPLGFTGSTEVGSKIPAGSAIETINANESGEVLNVGAAINGDIFAVVTLAEFAYILKKRSIQSIQSVGQAAGTFFIRPEILDEGPIGRYAWCRAGDREIAFVGTKGMYLYGGGQNLRPIASQHWEKFRDEVDWARADEIVAHHNRRDSEVWFAYPTPLGVTKVYVWNYAEDSVVVDRYPDELNGITALGRVDWELAPTWTSLDPSEKCNGAAKRWYEYVDVPEREYTLMAIGGDAGSIVLGEDPEKNIPRLLLHGRVWSRSSRDDCNPGPIPSLAETPDFDFGDPTVWKYVDTVYVVLNGRENVPSDATLQVSIGARDNLNSTIRWSPPQNLLVATAGAEPTKINTTVSGRYLRVRFSSENVGSNWGISGYHITARKGGTY